MKTIIIANVAEAFESVINKIENLKKRNERIFIEHNLCDRSLLWEGDEKIIVTPFKINESVLNLSKIALNYTDIVNFYPDNVGISLSDSIMQDKALFENLCNIIKDNPGIKISPYCVTSNFVNLIESFKNRNLVFQVCEMPEKNSTWLVSYLDSKVGSRMEIGKIKSISDNIPDSIICENHEKVFEVVKWFYNNSRSCVLKSNFGESGWGTLFLKKNSFKNEEAVLSYVKNEFCVDSIWNNDLILIEEYVSPSRKLSSGSPSSELFLSDSGVNITYICDQLLTDEGEFLGVALGKGLLGDDILNELRRVSLEIGNRFWNLGYRGFFDIDFILSDNNIPYVIETNMRRTGGTHVYDVAKRLFKDNWEQECFVISQDNFSYEGSKLSEVQIIEKMKEIMYPIGNEKEGVIISIVDKWSPTFGFIVVGQNNERALNIYNEVKKIWKTKN